MIPSTVPMRKGFDRINDAVFEMLKETDDFSREALLNQSEKWNVCPFELSLDVLHLGGCGNLRLQLCF